jgi:signal transduction histidine kinase
MVGLLGWAVVAIGACVVADHRRRLRLRRELVARACHELRGPLTAAALAVHASGREGEVPRLRVAAVELELRRAAVALDDLCAVLAGRRPRDHDEQVDVGDLLATQLDVWRAVAQARGCELRVAGPSSGILVRGDRLRIAQATGNLLANAVEHGGGKVDVAARTVDGRVRIEVADAGPGLPASVGELVARPRAGRGARGRGLAIAAEIVARHGGRLTAAGGEAGAHVAIELPAA